MNNIFYFYAEDANVCAVRAIKNNTNYNDQTEADKNESLGFCGRKKRCFSPEEQMRVR